MEVAFMYSSQPTDECAKYLLLSTRSQVMVDVDCRGTIAVAIFMAETSVDGVLLSEEALAELQFPGVSGPSKVQGSGNHWCFTMNRFAGTKGGH